MANDDPHTHLDPTPNPWAYDKKLYPSLAAGVFDYGEWNEYQDAERKASS